MTARDKDRLLQGAIERRCGVTLDLDDANALRRAEKTLLRWAERECGDGSDWAIERDETTGKPFNVYHGEGKRRRVAIPDLEAGALRRVAEVCARFELHFYHQGDPRGCMLYVSATPITDRDYTNGVACCDD